ncbi:ABC transporter ATP-binding protein [Anaerotruncus colihominis]|jgi:ABC-2 type transport system ATP-binding protein|uniref:ABC transporter ATP-binding protein n=1 Tax=Anaerotruncus colihominis TaxID=169435 RepID=A0A845RM90_9FIRM|nr:MULTISPECIES: ABC transporter ATP-binding protein [Anaerotruncus]MCI8492247.1 ABC transporter ATP-binding protein [Anaerotruncus sp.]NBI79955.1 ABC transporter ATP-binding protein [Anaerotruncus colihominis]
MNGNVIEIKDLEKRFHKSGFQLSLPSLCVREGYITGFVGENGAGKTTTIKLLMDMLRPDQGTVQVFGLDARADGETVRREIGYVGEESGFLANARLRALASMMRPFYPRWDDAALARYMERFGLKPDQKFKSLSKGKQKQFALAVALCRRPKLLLMDEPTANLDPLVRQEVLDLLAEEMEREGVSVFFSTHITSDLDKIADYLIFLHGGRLLLEGEKDRLIDTRRMVKGRRELLTGQARELLRGVEESDFGFRALCEDEAAVFALFGNEAVYEKPTIEDLFMAYTRKEGVMHNV